MGLLFLYQTWKKNRNTHLLTVGFILAFLGQFLFSLYLIQRESRTGYFSTLDLTQAIYLQTVLLLMVNGIIGFFWIFLERMESVSINRIMLIIMSSLLAVYLWTIFFGTQAASLIALGVYSNFIFGMMLVLATFRSTAILYNVYRATGKERTAASQLIAYVLLSFWALNAFLIHSFAFLKFIYGIDISFPNFIALFDIFYYAGLAIFIGTILTNPDYIYRLPLNIQDLVFLSNIGVALYGIGRNADEKSLDEQLLAGFLTATNSFIREMEPKKSDEIITIIQSRHRIVRIEYRGNLGICLVSLKQNYYLIRSMQDLLKFIHEKEDTSIIENAVFFEDETVRFWLKKFFPYLDIENMQTY